MSKWGDSVLKIANGNPDIVVADDSTMPDSGGYTARQNGNRYIASQTPTEAQEQAFLFDWIDANSSRVFALKWAFHSANGEYRHPATAAKLKTMGVRPGVPDILLPYHVYDAGVDKLYTGLAIELKRSDHSNKPTPEQEQWLLWLDSQDWRCVVCYGAQEAIGVICEYLGMED